MYTTHPLFRIAGSALLAMTTLALSACSGMTQQEKTPPSAQGLALSAARS